MLDIIKSAKSNSLEPTIVSGRGSKHRLKAMNRWERASFGADLLTGVVWLLPSLVQSAHLAQSTTADIRAELKARTEAPQMALDATGVPTVIANCWSRATAEEKEEAVRAIGVGNVWDAIARVVA